MLNVYKSTSSDIFISMCVYNSLIHANDMRQSSYFHIPPMGKEFSKSNICYKAAVVWDDIMKCNLKTT